MRNHLVVGACVMAVALLCAPTHADLISVSGPVSSAGTMAAIITAPANLLDDEVFNTGMQGFNEAQDVLTTSAYTTDTGVIAAGTLVDSHMIFLNSQGGAGLTHRDVTWTFAGVILGVMSDYQGTLEAASTGELGAPGSNYSVTFPGSGPAAPFAARGLEGGDSYSYSGNTLTITMGVSEPGDWIRVVTTGAPVPEPSTLALLGAGAIGLFVARRRRKNAA